MAQTTGALPMACAMVELSTDGCVNWTDVSGSTQSVGGTDQTRMSGEVYTFDGEGAIITRGKKEPLELAFSVVYTEETLEAYEIARAIFEGPGCEGDLCVRWAPAGGAVGTNRLQAVGPVIGFTYPAIDASSAGVAMGGFVVRTGDITTVTISS